MDIIKSIERFLTALERIAAALEKQPVQGELVLTEAEPVVPKKQAKKKVAKKKTAKKKVVEEPVEEEAEESVEPELTYADLRKRGKKIIDLKLGKRLKDKLDELGAESLQLLDNEHYQEVWELMGEILDGQ